MILRDFVVIGVSRVYNHEEVQVIEVRKSVTSLSLFLIDLELMQICESF